MGETKSETMRAANGKPAQRTTLLGPTGSSNTSDPLWPFSPRLGLSSMTSTGFSGYRQPTADLSHPVYPPGAEAVRCTGLHQTLRSVLSLCVQKN